MFVSSLHPAQPFCQECTHTQAWGCGAVVQPWSLAHITIWQCVICRSISMVPTVFCGCNSVPKGNLPPPPSSAVCCPALALGTPNPHPTPPALYNACKPGLTVPCASHWAGSLSHAPCYVLHPPPRHMHPMPPLAPPACFAPAACCLPPQPVAPPPWLIFGGTLFPASPKLQRICCY